MRRKGGKVLTALAAAAFGFVVGISFPVVITPKLQYGGTMPWSSSGAANSSFLDMSILGRLWAPSSPNLTISAFAEVATARKADEGTERRLPPGIVVSETDLHLRRLWGSPTQDSATRKYLLALAVGYDEKANVNATIQKFSDNFDIVLFHYDGRTTEWDEEFEWSKEVAHVSARKQTKWWFAKRFLHPSIVAPYDYIFLWDEDLGVENFTAEAYLDIVRKHGLEISQPGLDATDGTTNYHITIRRNDSEIHKFVEVMAPVFSRDAWRCVWHMIQNDFVHAWGLDSNFWRCVDDPEEEIGIVDAQYLVHHAVPTLQGQGEKEKEGGRSEVRARQFEEMRAFRSRVSDADNELANRTSSIQN
uniref:Uncharacterized protein n=2 Tax=Triticum aestivum TaxID=4565 RepID=A0A3B6SU37_WHEAT